jgi:diadenylate cyclase
MLEAIIRYFHETSALNLIRDFVDISVVYYLAYRLFLVARGTRAVPIGLGLAVVGLLYLVAERMGLRSVETLVRIPLESILIVSVVVFQSDIRRALERVGSRPLVPGLHRRQEAEVIDEVVEAARELARHRIGALITFEQDANLDEFVGNNRGIELDAKVTSELLVALFLPEGMNKMHDGSVVLRNLRVAKAGVFFPMPSVGAIDPSFGSRHRAAIGITEETDAIVVVVSEERGTISFCFNGNIASDLQAPQLREMLLSILNPKARKKSKLASRSRQAETPSARVESVGPTLEQAPPPPDLLSPPSPTASSVPLPLRKSMVPSVPPPPVHDSDEPPPQSQGPRPMPKAHSVSRSPSSGSPASGHSASGHSETEDPPHE